MEDEKWENIFWILDRFKQIYTTHVPILFE